MAIISTTSGMTLDGVTLMPGETLMLVPGATASATTVLGGAVLDDMGSTLGTVVWAGGTEDVMAYGTAIDTTVLSGGTQLVDGLYSLRGSAIGTTIEGGGVADVVGVVDAATVEAGGTLALGYGLDPIGTVGLFINPGSGNGVVVRSGGLLLVDGGLASGATIQSGGIALVMGALPEDPLDRDGVMSEGAGTGAAVATTVDSGGMLIALPGSEVSGTIGSVTSGGVVLFRAGSGVTYYSATASGLTVAGPSGSVGQLANDDLLVLSGGLASDVAIGGGGAATVYSGGTMEGGAVAFGGMLAVSSGGIASGVAVSSGGMAVVGPGGSALAVAVALGGTLALSGGSGLGDMVAAGGSETLLSGGMATSTTVGAGGTQMVGGGVATATTVDSGGTQQVAFESGRFTYADIASASVVSSGGDLLVEAGGTATGASILSGGGEIVFSGGIASDTTVASGGLLVLLPGAIAAGTTGDAVSTGVVLEQAGMGLTALGASASGLMLAGPATLYALPGATLADLSAGPGVGVDLFSGAVASGVALGSGDLLSAFGATIEGLAASGANLVMSGGMLGGFSLASGTASLDAILTIVSAIDDSGMTTYDDVISQPVVSGGTVGAGGYMSGNAVASGVTVASGGTLFVTTATDTVIQGGGEQEVAFGAAVAGTTIEDGGAQRLGGTLFNYYGDTYPAAASGTQVDSGGALLVGQQGTADGATVSSGGWEVVSAGGSAVNTTVDSGGALLVLSGGTATGTTGQILSGGVVLETSGRDFSALGGTVSGLTLSAALPYPGAPGAESLFVLAGGTADGVTVASGGAMDVQSGGTLDGVLIAGGTVTLEAGAVASGGIVFGSGGGTLVIGVGGGRGAFPRLDGATISGFTVGDTIEIQRWPDGVPPFEAPCGPSLEVPTAEGTVALGFDRGEDFNGLVFVGALAGDGSGNEAITLAQASTLACFAAGTRIRTARGEVPVEALRLGERVMLAGGGTAPVRWLGHRRTDCRRHPAPGDVWPVRVAAGAFGAGRPGRDLFLSPDHAVLTGGVLIPVRYLVNGATIAQMPVAAVTYWHVELPAHGVLLAEGLACESYLDTGNRAAFANGGGATQMHPSFARPAFARSVWDARGCAPLVLEGAALARARARLLARAARLGHRAETDPALTIWADGAPLDVEADGAIHLAQVPEGAGEVRLLSRVWVPAHMRPEASDTRALGVAISRIWVDGRAAGLDSPALSAGWHAPEAALRWTDGAATIVAGGVRALAFEVAMTGRYWRAASGAQAGARVA